MSMQVQIDKKNCVRAAHSIDLSISASALWGQMRDVQSFITWDPLHKRAILLDRISLFDGHSPRGAKLLIEHRLLGIGPDRLSRIVLWREGGGFAFSDLSKRGRTRGFPHVCAYNIDTIDSDHCRLTISARGRWTMPIMPRWAARLWLRCVLAATGRHIRNRVLALRWARLQNSMRRVIDPPP